MESQPILVKDLMVVVRTSGLAGAFLTCITIGGGFPRGGYFIKVGLGGIFWVSAWKVLWEWDSWMKKMEVCCDAMIACMKHGMGSV